MGPHSQTPIPEHQSIFGDTYHGVPSPKVPHTHPYPTRFHGPVNTIPRFMLPYREQSWQTPQGFTMQALHGLEPLTGSPVADALLGGLVGLLVAPGGRQRVLGDSTMSSSAFYAIGGAIGGLVAGGLGIGVVAGMGIYKRLGG